MTRAELKADLEAFGNKVVEGIGAMLALGAIGLALFWLADSHSFFDTPKQREERLTCEMSAMQDGYGKPRMNAADAEAYCEKAREAAEIERQHPNGY